MNNRQGYADIYLEPVIKEAKYRFIIEFKYIKSNELNKKSSIVEKTKKRAKQQLEQYSQRFTNENTKCVIIIAGSQELKFLWKNYNSYKNTVETLHAGSQSVITKPLFAIYYNSDYH